MKNNRILIILILVGIITSSLLVANRFVVESKNNKVDFTLDWEELVKLVDQSDKDLAWWLEEFKSIGFSSVTLNEETFDSLVQENKPLEVEMMGNLLKNMYLDQTYPKSMIDYIEKNEVDEYDLVVSTNSKETYDFIKKGLKGRYDKSLFKEFTDQETYVFLIDGSEKDALYSKGTVLVNNYNKPFREIKDLKGSKLNYLGIGYDQEKIDLVKDAGLDIIFRPINHNQSLVTMDYIEDVLGEYDRQNLKGRYILFSGDQVLGYPEYSKEVRDYIRDNNLKLGLIESTVQRSHIEQKGIDELASALDYNVVRVFSVWPYIQERYKYYNYDGAEEIENTLYRAITERNIRLIYFKPFKEDSYSYVTDPEEYEKTFSNLENRLKPHKIEFASASSFSKVYVKTIYKILIGLGVLGGGILLLKSIFFLNKKLEILLLILGSLGVVGFPFIFPNFSMKIYALGGGIVFPSLAMVIFSREMKRIYYGDLGSRKEVFLKGLGLLLKISLISLIGSLFVAGILSNTEYLLEIDIFRGVKLAQLLPILVYMCLYLGYIGYRKPKAKKETRLEFNDIMEVLRDNIEVYFVLLGLIVLAVGYVYLARTGHETDIQPSDFEMIVRNFLELKFIARPRTKEFLIAFPAVILAVYFMSKKYRILSFIMGLGVVIGQTSIVNTFTHIRTPLYLSFIRTAYGLIFGVLVAFIYLLIIELGVKVFKTLRGELKNE